MLLTHLNGSYPGFSAIQADSFTACKVLAMDHYMDFLSYLLLMD